MSIEEKIAEQFRLFFWEARSGKPNQAINISEATLTEAVKILALFKEAGYVKLAKNQELPPVVNELAFQETAGNSYAWYLEGQRDMLKAGFVRKVM